MESIGEGYYSQGHNTFKVNMVMHQENRQKLVKTIQQTLKDTAGHVAFFQGGDTPMKYDTDTEFLFIQESFFHYLFGVKEPGFCGMIDLHTGKSYLFIPKLPQEYAVWMGTIYPTEYFQKIYLVDEVLYIENIQETIDTIEGKEIHLLSGTNSDSGSNFSEPTFKGIEKYTLNKSHLYHDLIECRVIKSEKEIELLRYVNRITSEAHKHVMKLIKPGMMEYQAESAFQHYTYFHGGCRHCSYTCICGSGHNSSILHYGHSASPNNKVIKEGDMLLFDMGTTYHGYVSDVTCSFPVGGKFTEKQKGIYNIVLKANREVMKQMRPSVYYTEMQIVAYRVICSGLKDLGLLQGDLEEMMQNHVGSLFMPHGLGHLLGIDTHDVGGYNDGTMRSTTPTLKKLRTGRALKEGMVLTVEPGIYFIDSLILPALENPQFNKFLVKDKILPYLGFGGVRIEDDVVVTSDGVELLTSVPRTVEEIEEFFSK